MGGTTRYEGRVEIHMFDQWCTVNHEHWDNLDAGVVCSMLGYSRYLQILKEGMAPVGLIFYLENQE